MTQNRVESASRVVAAPAEQIFELLATPAEHPRFDGSGSVQAAREGNPERLELGAKFGMDMKIGLPYRIRNEVVEFTEGRRIAWRHFGGHIWRYTLEPVEGGTEVTEQFDWGPSKAPWLLQLSGFPEKNRNGIEATLERLAEAVEPTTTA